MPTLPVIDEPPTLSTLLIVSADSGLKFTRALYESLPGLVSVTPEGAATVAVLLKVPVRLGLMNTVSRSEERRVGEEGRAGRLTDHVKEKKVAPVGADMKVEEEGRKGMSVRPCHVTG